jgi:hypothetical protein
MKRLAALLAFFLAGMANAMPVEISAEYSLSSMGVTIGRVNESFRRTGGTYAIRSTTRSEGALKLLLDDSITLESRGRVNGDGLQPLEFAQRRASNSSRDIHATFDWDKGVLHSSYRGETKEVALPPATQDRISVLYQFMNLGNRAIPQVDMNMSNGRGVERYTYRFVEEVRVKTPAGDFDTFHYARVPDSAKNARTEVWLAKDRFNVPVRLVFDDPRGLKLEQVIVDLKVK